MRRLPLLLRLALTLALTLALWTPAARAAGQLGYTLSDRPAAGGGAWEVDVLLEGARAGAAVTFVLSAWGDGATQLELLESEPGPAEAGDRSWRLSASASGRARLRYRMPVFAAGSPGHERHGLLTARGPEHAFGYSWSTLVDVRVDGALFAGPRRLELVASGVEPYTEVVTGWAGSAPGRQVVELDARMGNAPIVFGRPRARIEDARVEVFQFGRGPERSEVVAQVVRSTAPLFARHLGQPAPRPYRAFVTDLRGGGMGSEFGLRIGSAEGEPAGASPWLSALVAHELFHHWLGSGLAEESPALVWFKEGFTEYFALWQVAAAGLVPRDGFAQRLLEHAAIAAARSSAGQVAFGDADVTWRDGDGPNETLVYSGAPLLALCMDAELRAAGHPGLFELVHDLFLLERPYSLLDLRTWMETHDLGPRYQRSIAGRALPSVDDSLALAGFTRVQTPVDLAYLGIQADGPSAGATILALDPDGPAFEAGARVGDVISGFWPARGDPIDVSGAEVDYSFGLAAFAPGYPGSYIGVVRDGAEQQLFVEPRLLVGAGALPGWSAQGTAAFFRYEP